MSDTIIIIINVNIFKNNAVFTNRSITTTAYRRVFPTTKVVILTINDSFDSITTINQSINPSPPPPPFPGPVFSVARTNGDNCTN